MTAEEIIAVLAMKHKDDLFIPQCKDGASYGRQMRQMDAWARKKSWANPLTTAYEVKVARSDFLGDTKWRDYLPLCNEFYFVAPKGLIQIDELSPEAGLREVMRTRVITRKKAPYREGALDESLCKYILMHRTQVCRGNEHTTVERDYWQRWLALRDEDKELGWDVSRKLQELVKTRITAVENKACAVAKENRALADVKALLEREGIDVRGWRSPAEEIERRLKGQVRNSIVGDVERLQSDLAAFLKQAQSSLAGAKQERRIAKDA